jgi:hypothetical protein
MLDMKTSINQIQTLVDSITRRQDQERISEMDVKTEELLHIKITKKKN